MNQTYIKNIDTPIGMMTAIATQQGICALEHDIDVRRSLWKRRVNRYFSNAASTVKSNIHIERTELWLKCYFNREWKDLPLIELDLRGSEFEMQVWDALRTIPLGKTLSYGELAIQIGRPKSSARAVGTACKRNPASLILPCHRVVGSNSKLTGYAGGLENKNNLLLHEQNIITFRS